MISVFPETTAGDASLTFNNFPLNGKAPNLSLPITLIADKTIVNALSPSVRISVHSSDFFVPANFASCSLEIPFTVDDFFPSLSLSVDDSLSLRSSPM